MSKIKSMTVVLELAFEVDCEGSELGEYALGERAKGLAREAFSNYDTEILGINYTMDDDCE